MYILSGSPKYEKMAIESKTFNSHLKIKSKKYLAS